MRRTIQIISTILILLGAVHVALAFPLQPNTDTLWFVGSGLAIIFAGLLNLVVLDRGGSRFSKTVALAVNAVLCTLFWYALQILNEPQVYVGIVITLAAALTFLVDLLRQKKLPS